MTFASGLRSILRQDPERDSRRRDPRSGDRGHRARAPRRPATCSSARCTPTTRTATITRLFDLGIQPFLIASSLLGIVAQRLVRRPCPACAVPQPPSAETIEKVGGASRLPPDGQWVAGRGCDQCGQSGLKGRIAIHEVLAVNDEVRDLISSRAPEHVIKKAGAAGRHADAARGRHREGGAGPHHARRSARAWSRAATRRLRVRQPTTPAGGARAPCTAAPGTAVAGEPDAAAPAAACSSSKTARRSCSVVKYFLELEGFEVLVAENGLIGLEMALRERPDVIVSDVNMPGMGGVAMVKALRADPRTANVRILMLTSESSVESETEGLAAGADDYILKPVEPRRLAARVKALRARSANAS